MTPEQIAAAEKEIAAFRAYEAQHMQPAPPQPAEHFKSAAELVQAIRDPRYREDQAYRREVAKKVANAAAAGVDLASRAD
jgi:hypothetical protein